jgi:hypothetical protein
VERLTHDGASSLELVAGSYHCRDICLQRLQPFFLDVAPYASLAATFVGLQKECSLCFASPSPGQSCGLLHKWQVVLVGFPEPGLMGSAAPTGLLEGTPRK